MDNQKQTVKFGDICREVKLSTKDPLAEGYDKYIGLEHLDSGSLKIKRWGLIAEDNPSFTRVFKKGHILFGKRRCYLKKAAIAEFDGICSGDIIVMEPQGDLMLPELLPFIVQSEKFWDWAIKTSSGSLSPRTKFKNLIDFNISKIDKIHQQSKLAILKLAHQNEKIVDDCLEKLEQFQVSIEKLEFNSELNYTKISDCKIELIDGDRGKYYPSGSDLTIDGYCLFLNAKNVTNEGFYFLENQFISQEKDKQLRKGKLIRGDILITTRGTVGNVAIYDKDVIYENLRINSGMLIIRNSDKQFLTEFIYLFLKSKMMKQIIENLSFGSAQPQLTVKVVEGLKLPIIPLERQRLFCKTLVDIFLTREKLTKKKNFLKVISNQII